MSDNTERTKRIEYSFDVWQLMYDLHKEFEDDSLRDISTEIGVSAATLSRMDRGSQPDMETFLKICGEMDFKPAKYFKRAQWELVIVENGGAS